MEISVVKAQAKLKANIASLQKLVDQDKKNRVDYDKAVEKADKAYADAVKKWENDVKKIVLTSVKTDNVNIQTHWRYSDRVDVSINVNIETIKLPPRPDREEFRKGIVYKQTEFPDRRDSRGYRIAPEQALYEMKNMVEWLDLVEGTTISRVSETKRLAVWL